MADSCIFCGRLVQRRLSLTFIFSIKEIHQSLMCSKCQSHFEPLHLKTVCPGCSRIQSSTTPCSECRQWTKKYPNLTPNHHALFSYNTMAKDYMERYKFKGDILLAEVFSQHLREYLKPFVRTHTIVPLPISVQSHLTRGFNQVDYLLEQAKVPHQKLLINETTERKQTLKNKEMRLKSTQPFSLDKEAVKKQNIKKSILLVDDVYTTGRTIYHAREALSGRFETVSLSLFR